MTPDDYAEARRYFEGVSGLFLSGFELTEDLTLIVTVDEASAEPAPRPVDTGNPEVDRAIGTAHPVTTRPGHRRFVVEFDAPVHAVTDESFAMPSADEDFSSQLRRREASPFLDFARASTYAVGDEARGPLSHISLVTFDAVIDVATRVAPEITVIRLTDTDLSEDGADAQ